jgi:hypothetical protein
MLSAIARKTMTAGKNDSKNSFNSFIDWQHAADAGLDKKVDKKDYQFAADMHTNPKLELQEQILVSYQQPVNAQRSTFLSKIASDSMAFLSEARGLRVRQLEEQRACVCSMTTLVKRISDTLEGFAVDYNSAVGFSELRAAVTRPDFVTEIVRYTKTRQPLETLTKFRSRIATAYYSIVIRGDKDAVQVYILPSNQTLGLSKSEARYEPAFVLTPELMEDGVGWNLDNKPLTQNAEEVFCMELFLKLVNLTKAQIKINQEENELSVDLNGF